MGRAAPGLLRIALVAGMVGAAIGCSSSDRAPFLGNRPAPPAKPDSGSDDPLDIPPPKPPAIDAGGLCGNVVIPIETVPLNLYFVIDMSGSMERAMPRDDAVNGFVLQRYLAARVALRTVLRAVGHRVSYGAAWYPDDRAESGCEPGYEFFATREGDLQSFAVTGREGPVLSTFMATLGVRGPFGGTPTAATLSALLPKLTALPGKTYAFLITDGAPTCSSTTCGKETCTYNIEDGCPDPNMNCCDPANGGTYSNCLDDRASIEAVRALAEGGVRTFVIGMPGSDIYVDTLNRLAAAGETPRAAPPFYYQVKSSTELEETLRHLAEEVATTCDATFDTAPPDPRLVNVFFDSTLVPRDPDNGWTWDGDRRIVLVGAACEQLKNGRVGRLQVVAGCPSISR